MRDAYVHSHKRFRISPRIENTEEMEQRKATLGRVNTGFEHVNNARRGGPSWQGGSAGSWGVETNLSRIWAASAIKENPIEWPFVLAWKCF